MIDTKLIEYELQNMYPGEIVLVETTPESALEVSLATLKALSSKNMTGIIISATRPFSNLKALYERNNIDLNKLFFIDVISKGYDPSLKDTDRTYFIASVSDLTKISIALAQLFEKIKEDKYIFIDSISSMLIHNNPQIFARFIHGLLTKMRIKNVSGILISLTGETNKEVRSEIAQLCDKIIKV